MRIKDILALFFSFYFLVLFQISFLAHFPLLGLVPNLVLAIVLLLVFWEKKKTGRGDKKNIALTAAVFAGFFLDIFSDAFIGFHILSLLAAVLLLNLILQRYIRLPIFG